MPGFTRLWYPVRFREVAYSFFAISMKAGIRCWHYLASLYLPFRSSVQLHRQRAAKNAVIPVAASVAPT